MSHITRIFHCNVGHRGSWRPPQIQKIAEEAGEHAPFTIVQLENGGGKTTDISLILAIFEPNLRRFLPNLSQLDKEVVARQFRDYFHPDGIPGIVAVEFVTPTGSRTDQKRIVGYVASNAEGEVERDFFMISCESDLVPRDELAMLPGGPGGTPVLRTRSDTRTWLKTMNSRTDFETRSRNKDWEVLLVERGFDLPGLKMLLDINRRESNGNMGFFAHRTERDFLVSVLGNLVDEQDALDNFRHYSLMQEQIARLEPRRRALKLLETLRGHADRYASKAEQYASSTSRLAVAQSGRTEIFARSLRSLELARKDFERIEGEIAEAQAEADTTSGLLDEADAEREAATTALLTMRHEASKKTLDHAKTTHDEAVLHEAAVSGAEMVSRSASLAEQRRILQARIDSDNHTIQPYVEAEASAKGVLAGVLSSAIRSIRQRILGAENAEKVRARDEADLAGRARSEDEDIQEVRLEGAKLETEISGVRQDRVRLETEGILVAAGETAPECSERLERQIGACVSERIRLDETKATLAGSKRNLSQKRDGAVARRSASVSKLDTLTKDAAKEETARRNCTSDERIPTFFSGQVDVGMPGVLERLSEACGVVEQEMRDLELRRSRLTELAGTVSRHGVVFDRPDAERVLEKLRDHGFSEAEPGGSWLSNVVRDSTKAEDAVRSDPLSLDLVVPTSEMLARCVDILSRDPVDVLTPVTISVASTSPVAVGRERFVAMPTDAKEWNSKTAFEFAESREVDAARIRERIAELRSTLVAYRDAMSRIRSWLQDYGPEWADATRETIEAETLLRDEIGAEILSLDEQVDAVRSLEADLLSEFELLSTRKADLANAKSQVDRLASKEKDLASARIRMDEIAATIPGRERALTEMRREIEGLKEKRIQLALLLQTEGEKKLALSTRLQRLGRTDIPVDDSAIAIDDAQSAYDVAASALSDKRKGLDPDLSSQAAGLTKQITELENQLSTHLRRNPGLDLHRCEVVLASVEDFDASADHAFRDRLERRSAFDAAIAAESRCGSDLDRHVDQRRHPDRAAPVFVDEDAAEAAIGRIAEARTSLGAKLDEQVRLLEGLRAEETRAGGIRDTLAAWMRGQKESFEHVEALSEPLEDIDEAMKRFAELTKDVNRLEKEAANAREQAETILATITSFVSREDFLAVEAMVSQNIKESSASAFLDEPRRLLDLVEDRIACTDDEIGSLDEIVDALSGRLRSFLDAGIRLLKDLAGVKIPASSPVAPNRPIIRFRKGALDATPEMREIHMRHVVEKMTVAPLKVQDGVFLLVDLVLGLCGGNPGIEVLKPSPTDGDIYVPYGSMSHSGGEKLSVGMMFFAAYARVSCKNRGRPMRRCGTMILDNPLGAMTSANLWETTLSVLRHMEVQVVAYTGVMEANVHRQFPYHVVMGRFPSSDGYTNVRPVDFVIADGAVAA